MSVEKQLNGQRNGWKVGEVGMYDYEDAWVMTAQLNEKKDGCELCMRPLVLCKDCKYGTPGACGDGIDCDGIWHDDDWFCADGERK